MHAAGFGDIIMVRATPPNANATFTFSVRCVFIVLGRKGKSKYAYEERIVSIAAASIDDAIDKCDELSAAYASDNGLEDIGLRQAFEVEGCIPSGTELFSLLRWSNLEPDAYLDRFFDTGDEITK